jgi:hypothetical protein
MLGAILDFGQLLGDLDIRLLLRIEEYICNMEIQKRAWKSSV